MQKKAKTHGQPKDSFWTLATLRAAAGLSAMAVGLMLSGCALPHSSVLLFPEREPARIKVSELPRSWQGRLIRSRAEDGANTIGGDAFHRDVIAHRHEGVSENTPQGVRPLGVRDVTVDHLHRHAVESVSTEPADSAPAEAKPPSFGLRAVVLEKSIFSRTPTGLVVGYVGEGLPEGWLWCDGEKGTPDLRDRYLQLNGDLGPGGSVDHAHDAPHHHQWATADNEDHPAYFGDPAPGLRPVEVAQRVHRHSPGEESVSEGHTDRAINRPPALGVRFIMAAVEGAKVPAGAILPYFGARAPVGWRSVGTRFGEGMIGRLLRGNWAATAEPQRDGSLLHAHRLVSRHEFELKPVGESAGHDLAGEAPEVPAADHIHPVRIEAETDTGAVESGPPFVDLLIIIKS